MRLIVRVETRADFSRSLAIPARSSIRPLSWANQACAETSLPVWSPAFPAVGVAVLIDARGSDPCCHCFPHKENDGDVPSFISVIGFTPQRNGAAPLWRPRDNFRQSSRIFRLSSTALIASSRFMLASSFAILSMPMVMVRISSTSLSSSHTGAMNTCSRESPSSIV